MIGTRVSHFEILDKLGQGGMGVVYKAKDTQLDRLVALKVLPESAARDEDRRQRFFQEAKAASALNHPNIVTIYEIFSDGGNYFIAMELVRGKTLSQMITAKGLPVADILTYATQMADALAKAHGAGILHRDLKPANVMVTGDDLVKVLDFGLAKLQEAGPAASDATLTALDQTPLTDRGVIMGTVAYMSPEQAEAKPLDARSDIFSFGSLLYEMVTGRKAFSGESRVLTMASLIREEPTPVSELAPGAPRGLERVIERCMRKQPDRRIQSMIDIKHALEDLREDSLSGRTSVTGLTPAAPRRSPWIIPAAVAVLAAAGLAGFLFYPRGKPAADLKAIPVTSFAGREVTPAISPDGKQVAFAWDGPAESDNFDIYVKLTGTGDPLRLTSGPGSSANPVWSPDSRFIAFSRFGKETGLYVVPSLGGTARKISDSRANRQGMAWSKDSRWIAFADFHALSVLNVESGQKHKLELPAPHDKGHAHPAFPTLSPDGKRLAFVTDRKAFSIWTFDVDPSLKPTSQAVEIVGGYFRITGLDWTPDGKEIVFAASQGGPSALYRATISAGSSSTILPGAGDHANSPTLAASEGAIRIAYAHSDTDTNLWRRDLQPPAAASVIRALASSRFESNPAFSPNGSQIAFGSGRSGLPEIYVSNADGSGLLQLTSNGPNFLPVWSPDGTRILIGRIVDGKRYIYSISPRGGPAALIQKGAYFYSWSHDGKWIIFGLDTDSDHPQLARIPSSGGKLEMIGKASPTSPTLGDSPDGKVLYYLDRGKLWQAPVDGTKESVLLALADHVHISQASRGFHIWDHETGIINFLPLANWQKREFARLDDKKANTFAVSPDGKTLIYSRADQSTEDIMVIDGFR